MVPSCSHRSLWEKDIQASSIFDSCFPAYRFLPISSLRVRLPRAQNGVWNIPDDSRSHTKRTIQNVYFSQVWQLHTFQLKKCVFISFLEFLTRPRTRNSLWLCARHAKSMREIWDTCSSLHSKGCSCTSVQIALDIGYLTGFKGSQFPKKRNHVVTFFRSSLLGLGTEVCVWFHIHSQSSSL